MSAVVAEYPSMPRRLRGLLVREGQRMTTDIYRDSYRRCLSLYNDADFSILPEPILENFIRALEKRILPRAARRLYSRQRDAVARYEAVLLGIFDEFEDTLIPILVGGDAETKKRMARQRIDALAYWMVIASWPWLHYGAALGKLSVWLSQTDQLTAAWEWQRNRMFVYRKLAPDLIAAVDRGIDADEDIKAILDKFRWRIRMYSGAMWIAMQKAAIYRPPPDERKKAKEKWMPPVKWWAFPLLFPLAFPLLWEPPEEWDVPAALAPEMPWGEVARQQMYWHGLLTESTCVGERGCWDRIGHVWPVAALQGENFWPGVMDCFGNCRCYLIPVNAQGELSSDLEDYQWPL